MRHVRSASLLTPVLLAALVAAGCSSEKEAEPEPGASKGSSAKLVEVSPLTGEPMPGGRPDNPVLVVKIENTSSGAPQVGLDKADLVVEQVVEGGLTRLAALYYSTLPRKVGHVRSLRNTDIGIAKPVDGQIVASGGAGSAVRKVERADLTVHSEDAGAPGFSSDPAKSRPYNRLVDLRKLGRKAEAGDLPGPYLDWTAAEGKGSSASPEPSASASAAPQPQKATRASVRFSRSTTTSWALKGSTWKRTNGFARKEFAADTVIAMFCDVGQAGYRDPAGNPVPETTVRGSGRAVLLTKDGALETTWTKAKNGSRLTFESKDGSPVTIDPGKVWIELVPKGDGAVDVR